MHYFVIANLEIENYGVLVFQVAIRFTSLCVSWVVIEC